MALLTLLLQTNSSAGGLQWGRPSIASTAAVSATATGTPIERQVANPLRSNARVRDEQVTPAVWGVEEDAPPAASQAQFDPFEVEDLEAEFVELTPTPQAVPEESSEIDEDLLPTVDHLADDNRVAQLVEDPFDEPLDGPVPPLDEDLEDVSEAIRREQELRNLEREQSTQQDREPEQGIDLEGLVPPSEAEPIPRFPRITPGMEAEQSRKNCEAELQAAKADRISNVDLNIRIDGTAGEDFPFTCGLGNEPLQPRSWATVTYNWKASAVCHKPLYFEQAQLERHGHDWGPALQPLLSGVHFFTSAAILPYKMGIETPNECIYALGHYRPGSCAPYIIEATPFTWRAAFYQAGVITGMSFAIP